MFPTRNLLLYNGTFMVRRLRQPFNPNVFNTYFTFVVNFRPPNGTIYPTNMGHTIYALRSMYVIRDDLLFYGGFVRCGTGYRCVFDGVGPSVYLPMGRVSRRFSKRYSLSSIVFPLLWGGRPINHVLSVWERPPTFLRRPSFCPRTTNAVRMFRLRRGGGDESKFQLQVFPPTLLCNRFLFL